MLTKITILSKSWFTIKPLIRQSSLSEEKMYFVRHYFKLSYCVSIENDLHFFKVFLNKNYQCGKNWLNKWKNFRRNQFSIIKIYYSKVKKHINFDKNV